jgi:hypothetical protein
MTDRPTAPATDHAAWGARFGWIVGGALGLVLGFVASYFLEVRVLRARVADPTGTASNAAAVLVPLFFIAGALSGHAFGGKGGATRYKALGVSAGLVLAALGWALLVLTR